MLEWRTCHHNARVQNSRCDINYIVLPEKHVDIIAFKPCSEKCEASRKFSDINVQKPTMNSELQLYAVLLL